MKRFLFIVLSCTVIYNNTSAQNTLDNLGLTGSTPSLLAYSVRLLSSSYAGSALQVRRSSDNATQNIGFTGAGDLDTASLKTFVGINTAYVSIWYDQSGNDKNLSQGTASHQPVLVNAGVINRENGEPFIRFYTNSGYNSLQLASAQTTTGQVVVINKFADGGDGFILGHTSSYYWHSYTPNYLLNPIFTSTSVKNSKVFQNGRAVQPALAVWNTKLMINFIAPETPASSTTWDNIGSDRNAYHRTDLGGGYAELIIFSTANTSSDRKTIETNQSLYYTIALAKSINKYGQLAETSGNNLNRNGAIGAAGILRTGESIVNAAPTISTTTAASSITIISAASGGVITSDMGATLIGGVCWNTLINPTVALSTKTVDVGTAGSFTSNITNLRGNTTYYVRAYAMNDSGTVYGNQVSFTTLPPVLPTLAATAAASSILGITATSGGEVISDGGADVTDRGVCWNTSPTPTTANTKTTDGTGIRGFSSDITCLTANTTYYVRAYATNSVGTAYGAEMTFTTITLNIGDSLQGGIIAYILQGSDSGYDPCIQHGLIASYSDQGTSAPWGCAGTGITDAEYTDIGTGEQNTFYILDYCYISGMAAEICQYYSNPDFGGGTYYGWYLPSKDELNKLYINKAAIGGFSNNNYWSSSEIDNDDAWLQNFSNGSQLNNNKDNTFYVRAIRSF
jgi:hypothetical protein